MQYPAAAFFLQRARQVSPGFSLAPEDIPWVKQICSLVEGSPLGIEMAAVWVRVLSVREIAREMERSLDFLNSTWRDLPLRHYSLRAVFYHSWQLLSQEEQTVLSRLSIFRGGFGRRAADQVAGASLASLAALVAKSLIYRTAEDRYDLHEVVRFYAGLELAADPAAETACRNLHSQYYLSMLCEYEENLLSQHRQEALEYCLMEMSNVLAAWQWAVQGGQVPLLWEAAWPLFYLHELRRLYQQGEQIFTLPQSSLPGGPEGEIVGAYLQSFRAYFVTRLRKFDEAHSLLTTSEIVLRRHEDPAPLAESLLFRGLLSYLSRSYAEEERCLQEAYLLSVRAKQVWELAANTVLMGMVQSDLGEHLRAYHCLQEGLQRSRRVGDPVLIATALSALIQAVSTLGLQPDLELLVEEGLELSAQAGRWPTKGLLLEQIAKIAY
jgi:hypothetical protein